MALVDYLLQPGEVASPDKVQRMRKRAEMLGLRGSDTSPVQHWSQGAARLVDGLMGGLEEAKADKLEAAGRKASSANFNSIAQALMGAPLTSGGTGANDNAGTPATSPLTGTFDDAVSRVLKYEGGYTVDNGGPTNYGISSRANPDVDVKNLTPDAAKGLYKSRYWDAIGGDQLAAKDPRLAFVAFDTAVNAGPGTAQRLLQQSGGDPQRMLALRQQFNNGLIERDPSQYGKYADGWKNRLADIGRTIGADDYQSVRPGPQVADAGQYATPQSQPQQAPAGDYKPVQVASLDSGNTSATDAADPKQQPGPAYGIDTPMAGGQYFARTPGGATRIVTALAGDQQDAQKLPQSAVTYPDATPVIPQGASAFSGSSGPPQPQAATSRPGASVDASGASQGFTPQQVQQHAARPEVQAAAAQHAQTQQGQKLIAQSGNLPVAALLAAANDQWMSDGQRSLIMMLAQQRMQQANQPSWGFQTAGDTLYRTNSRTGAVEPVQGISKQPTYGVIGQDSYGHNTYGWIDPSSRSVTPAQGGGAPGVPGAQPADSVIPPPPPGVDPKLWREEQTKNYTARNTPATFETERALRNEVRDLPSYKNLAQAAPIYRSMFRSAPNNSRASDLNLVYGLGKIMDPGSVVREGEMVMVKNTAGLPDWLVGTINSLNGGAAMTPDTRSAIMREAYLRLSAYRDQFDIDTENYRGFARGANARETMVIPKFGDFQEWQAPAPVANPSAPASAQRQPGQGDPVPVRTPEEASRLPSGTPIRLPDGSIGRVP